MYLEVQYPACPPLFLSHSVAVAAWSGISHIAWRAGYSPGLFKSSFQILRGLWSWVFVDNFIHYTLILILYSVDSWRIWRPACFLYKIWQVSFVPCLGGLGCVCWSPVLDGRHASIRTEQFSFVYCFIHIFTAKERLHFFL